MARPHPPEPTVMPSSLRVSLALALLAAVAGTAGAANRGFFPGDAFFHTTLTKQTADALRGEAPATLGYVRPEHAEWMFCGYTGYWNARLPAGDPVGLRLADLNDRLRREVEPRRVEQWVDSEGNHVERELNGFRLFFYNANYDADFRKIGIRYNETWIEDQAAFGSSRSAAILESFVIDSYAFSLDWRDAADVPPLATICPPPPELPKVRFGNGGPEVKEPVTFDGPILAVVTQDRDLRRYLRPKKGTTYYVVTADGVVRRRYEGRRRGWEADDWPEDGGGEDGGGEGADAAAGPNAPG